MEVCDNGKCVAIHSLRGHQSKNEYVTNNEHYPPQHKAYLEVTPSYVRERARKIGDNVFMLVDSLMKNKHPLRYLRRTQGIVSLEKKYDADKIDEACVVALECNKLTLGFIQRVIKNYSQYKHQPTSPKREENSFLRQESLFH